MVKMVLQCKAGNHSDQWKDFVMKAFDAGRPNVTAESARELSEELLRVSVEDLLAYPGRKALIETGRGETFALLAAKQRYRKIYYLGMEIGGAFIPDPSDERVALGVTVLRPLDGCIVQGKQMVIRIGPYTEEHFVKRLTIT